MLHVGSIREICQELTKNGVHVSEYAIRRWVKLGALPVAYAGRKALISYSSVIKLLERGTDYA